MPVSITLPNPQRWPSVACTLEELERLRTAFRSTGPEREVFNRIVQQAEEALGHEVVFPPEGGQHNQWYQCDKCQIGLQTVDDTHHKCPTCGEVYSGYPYDNVIFSRKLGHLTRDMNACAWVFALSGEEKFASRAREILLGFAERYTQYPYHSANQGKKTDNPSKSGGHVYEQTLNEASWMQNVCEAYDLIRLSSVFSEADRQAVRGGLLMPVYHNIDKHKAEKSNWQTYHNSAFMYIGGVLNHVDLVKQAIEDPENGFYYQMKVSVLPEGMWYENSWGYHFYTLGAVQDIVETARRLDIDLYQTPEVKKMYTVAMDYKMTDGTLPRFGDATTTGIPGRRYEVPYHQWKDPEFLSILSDEPTWDSVMMGRTEKPVKTNTNLKSVLKPGAGHAILRANGPDGESSAVLTFGPFGGFHGHFDKLSFVYFALGKEQGYDPGRARSQAYRLPVHKNWYRATTSHNTVMVDRKSQEGVEGRLELFVVEDGLSAAAADVDKAYEGIVHHRLLILRPEFLVVADVLDATDDQEHTFDWLYHNCGDSVMSRQATGEAQAPEGQGFEYLQNVRRGTASETVRATVANGEDRVHIMVDGEPGSGVMLGTGVGESVLDRIPMVVVTRKGKSARFAAVIDPAKGGMSSQVADVVMEGNEGDGYIVRVTLVNGDVEAYAYDPDGGEREVLGRRTTSKLLCLKQSAQGEITVLAKVD